MHQMLLFSEYTWSLIASILFAYVLPWLFSSTHYLCRPFFMTILKANSTRNPFLNLPIRQALFLFLTPYHIVWNSGSALSHSTLWQSHSHLIAPKAQGLSAQVLEIHTHTIPPDSSYLAVLGNSPGIFKPQLPLPVRIRSDAGRVLANIWFILSTQ